MNEVRRCDCCGVKLGDDMDSDLCGKVHLVRCIYCGDLKAWEGKCSCAGETYLESRPDKKANCAQCGEPYYRVKKSERHCTRRHYKKCDVEDCNTVFRIYDMNRISKGCSPSHRAKLTHTNASRAKRKANNMERHGVEYTFQREDVKEKLATNENVKSTQIGGERFLAVMKEKYGVENYGEIHGKLITGDRNPMRRPEVKEKVAATNLERYGSTSPLGSKEVRDRAKATMVKRYGVEKPLQHPDFLKKAQDTLEERTGFRHPYQNRARMEQLSMERYGVRTPLEAPEIKAKIAATNLERYGAENPFASREIQEKIRATNLERYGVENPSQSQEIQAKAMATYERNVNAGIASKRGSRVSKLNRNFLEWVESNHGVKLSLEKMVDNFAFDFFLEECNLLIDLNPTVSHNTERPYGCVLGGCDVDCTRHRAVDPLYHQGRSLAALEAGYGFFAIYDWMPWENVVPQALTMAFTPGDRWMNLDCFPSSGYSIDISRAKIVPPAHHWSRGKRVSEVPVDASWLPIYDAGAVIIPTH